MSEQPIPSPWTRAVRRPTEVWCYRWPGPTVSSLTEVGEIAAHTGGRVRVQDGDLVVDNPHGELRCRPGDWLLMRPGECGDVWVVEGGVFGRTYEVRA